MDSKWTLWNCSIACTAFIYKFLFIYGEISDGQTGTKTDTMCFNWYINHGFVFVHTEYIIYHVGWKKVCELLN